MIALSPITTDLYPKDLQVFKSLIDSPPAAMKSIFL